ncbi:2237_t:CDS:2, partial [Racocetra fulgida]
MDTSLPKESIPEVIAKQLVLAINISIMDQYNQMSLEDKETDAFLDEVHKKKIRFKVQEWKGVNKLKQELFAPKLSIQDPSIEQNQPKGVEDVTEISETLCPRKLASDNKSSIDEASHHLA